jgi:hypothetical protein
MKDALDFLYQTIGVHFFNLHYNPPPLEKYDRDSSEFYTILESANGGTQSPENSNSQIMSMPFPGRTKRS